MYKLCVQEFSIVFHLAYHMMIFDVYFLKYPVFSSGLPHPGKVLDFCSPQKSLNFVYKSLKISGRFPMLLNNKHKKIRYMKEWILSPVEIALNTVAKLGGKWGHAPRDAGLGGASAHFLQSFKNAF